MKFDGSATNQSDLIVQLIFWSFIQLCLATPRTYTVTWEDTSTETYQEGDVTFHKLIAFAHTNQGSAKQLAPTTNESEPSTDTVQRIPLGTFVEREGENGSNYRGTISKFESG